MVAFFCPPPFMGGKGPIALEFHGYHDIPYAASVTVSNVDIGEPSPDRLVLLVTHMVRNGTTNLVSASVGEQSAEKIIDVIANNAYLGVATAVVSAGWSANVQLTLNANPGRNILLGVYSLKNYKNPTPVIGTSAGGSLATRTASVSVPLEGVGMVFASKLNSLSSTWSTTINQDYKVRVSSDDDAHSALSGYFPDGGTASGSINCRAIASLAYS